MRLILVLTFVLLLFLPVLASADGKAKKVPYYDLKAPYTLFEKDDGRIEVVSFFWYGCPSCSRMDQELRKWAEKLPQDVKFVKSHIVFSSPTDTHSKVFYALRALGLESSVDQKVFEIFINERKPINSEADLERLATKLKIDEKKLTAAFKSPEVAKQVDKIRKLMDTYQIEYVPSLIINGKYSYNVGMVDGLGGYIKQAEELIERERQARKK